MSTVNTASRRLSSDFRRTVSWRIAEAPQCTDRVEVHSQAPPRGPGYPSKVAGLFNRGWGGPDVGAGGSLRWVSVGGCPV